MIKNFTHMTHSNISYPLPENLLCHCDVPITGEFFDSQRSQLEKKNNGVLSLRVERFDSIQKSAWLCFGSKLTMIQIFPDKTYLNL